MFKVGDKVSILNEKGTATVVNVISDLWLEVDVDGFVFKKHITEVAKQIFDESHIKTAYQKEEDLTPEIGLENLPENIQIYFDKRLKGRVLEIDLHFHVLTEKEHLYPHWKRLQLQLDFLQQYISYALNKKCKKIIVIHGIGSGVLKAEVLKLLPLYPRLRAEDASYQKYGQGATELLVL